MFSVTKEVYFCYGHRLMNHPGKCRNIHGHSAKAAITLCVSQLNEQAMVCDFADIQRAAAEFIDEMLDHNFLLHRDDPLCEILSRNGDASAVLNALPTSHSTGLFTCVRITESE